MRIFIDGDNCPKKIRLIVSKRCQKENINLFIYSDRLLPEREESYGTYVLVNEITVDEKILKEAQPGDWVLTKDFPLVLSLLERGVSAFNDRGRIFKRKEVENRIRESELMQALRQTGAVPTGAKKFGPKEIYEFSKTFDQIVLQGR